MTSTTQSIKEFNEWANQNNLSAKTTSFLRTVLLYKAACKNAHRDKQRAKQAASFRTVVGIVAGQIIGAGC